MSTCKFCGQPSTLLCDGRIWTRGDGKVFRSLRRVPGATDRSCDAPVCRQCAEKIGDICMRIAGGCRWDTRDLCPDCQQAKDGPVEILLEKGGTR